MFRDQIKDIKVKDILKSYDVITVSTDMLARDISVLFAEKNISGAPVVCSNNKLVGVVSMSDISRSEAILDLKGVLELIFFSSSDEVKEQINKHLNENYSDLVGEDIMTPNPITANPDDSLIDVLQTMLEHKIHRVIVLEDDRISGILTMTDILSLFINN